MRDKDLSVIALLVAPALLLPLALWALQLSVFWGDLTYLHHPWRALAAEMIHRGELPLWNPYAYLGMPLAAEMQCGVWYPGSLPFHIFGFAAALSLFHALHFGLAGFFAFLWLRRDGFARPAAFAGAALFMGCGSLVSRAPFLNHLSTLAYFPAFLLFRRRAALLALAMALSFLSGYPLMMIGAAIAALLYPLALGLRPNKSLYDPPLTQTEHKGQFPSPSPGERVRRCTRSVWVRGFSCLIGSNRGSGDSGSKRRLGAIRKAVRDSFGSWVAAGALSAGVCACLLLPALELTLRSRRAAGLDLEQMLAFAMTPSDWRQWISPLLVARSEFSPSLYWWKTCYLGFFSWAAVILGLARLNRRAGFAAALLLSAIGLLLLGGSNALSREIWVHIPILRYLRYPGNLAYLAIPLFAWLAASGLQAILKGSSAPASSKLFKKSSLAWIFALGLWAELLTYALFSQALAPSSYFTTAGPLIRQLQLLSPHRYHISPNALHWQRARFLPAEGFLDLNQRLYGETNIPFRLFATVNYGEPLVPMTNFEYLDFVLSRKSLDDAAPALQWSDAAVALTLDRLASKRLRYLGWDIWHGYQVTGLEARALWFDPKEGSDLQAGVDGLAVPPDPAKAMALRADLVREDRLAVRGDTPAGWVYLAEPKFPGWEARLNGARIESLPALGAFQKFQVPSGHWELRLRYAPASWSFGWGLTLLCLMGLWAYWYNRAWTSV